MYISQKIWWPLPWFTFKLNKNTTAIQTDISKEVVASTHEYLCWDCDYEVNCIRDFNDPTTSSDGLENFETSYFSCNFCDKSCETLLPVMQQAVSNTVNNSYGNNCLFIGIIRDYMQTFGYKLSNLSKKWAFWQIWGSTLINFDRIKLLTIFPKRKNKLGLSCAKLSLA